MPNQTSRAPKTLTATFIQKPGGFANDLNGNGQHPVEIHSLRRQVRELERRLAELTASERQVREDLLNALASSQAATKEQARLHTELAAKEQYVSEIVASEAALRTEIAEARSRLAAAQDETTRLEAVREALMRANGAAAQAEARSQQLARMMAQRAQLLGFMADQIKRRRSRLASMHALLEHAGQGGKKALLGTLEEMLAARQSVKDMELRLQNERWFASHALRAPHRGVPLRRNRPAKLLEKILCRLGPLGVAAALKRSGLWNKAFRADVRSSARSLTLRGYVMARPDDDVALLALFDQRFYLASNPAVAGLRRAPLAHYLVHGDREGRSPHPLVDVRYYRSANAREMGATGLTVLQHFLFIGAAEGRNPHPLFDVKYYVGQLSDPADLKLNPLVHYLRTGWRRGLNPHPLFDNDWYLDRYPDVAEAMIPPLLHYVTEGARDGRDPHPLFYSRWYETVFPDVVASGQNPLAHYVARGLAERRNPNPFFETGHYLEMAPEAWSDSASPLQHYLQRGAFRGLAPNPAFDCLTFLAENPGAVTEKRTPFEAWIAAGAPGSEASPPAGTDLPHHPASAAEQHRPTLERLFDTAYYRAQAGELLSPDQDALGHYLLTGWRLGFDPHPLFDTVWYAWRHPETIETGTPPLLHFAMTGAEQLQDPHPLFDSRWYAERYPDVQAGREIPLIHYLVLGAREGRSPSRAFDASAYLAAYPDIAAAGENPLIHFLTRWPFDSRPHGFASEAATSPHGADPAEWVAGIADAFWQASGVQR